MEPFGARNAYKLPRITGSNSGSKNLSEGPDREVSVVTVGQSNSCSVYQQHGGYSIPRQTDLAKALWMWALSNDIVLTAEYIPGVVNVIADAESRSMMDRAD